MRIWSERFPRIAFACVCVEAAGRTVEVARDFQTAYFGDSSVFNSFIRDQEDFPTFPSQLGCQGFVIVDEKGRFATLRSPSLNKVGKAAFEYVERVLAQLMATASDLESLESAVEKRRGEEDGRELRYGTWQDSEPPQPQQQQQQLQQQQAARAKKWIDEGAKVDLSPASAPGPKAVFAEHACRDAPQPLDEGACPLCLELPSVGHARMDAEHAELEDLMGACVKSLRASDVEALRASFERHALEEEDLMRRSGFGGGGGGGMFSAVNSHAADHQNILKLAAEVAASATCCGKVSETDVRRLCRNIIEHAVNFDSRYAGQLHEESNKRRRGSSS
mmetsp:Transcript_3746/g.8543  ORF Transcript_3746/g.8543 Transcript_3746/m.8543 type:complete len:334 (+) Transcript_3746:376-1377(+)